MILNSLNFDAVPFRTATIPADELGRGAELKIREFTSLVKIQFSQKVQAKDVDFYDVDFQCYYLRNSLVTEDNKPLLKSDEEAKQFLGLVSIDLLTRLNEAITKLNTPDHELKN